MIISGDLLQEHLSIIQNHARNGFLLFFSDDELVCEIELSKDPIMIVGNALYFKKEEGLIISPLAPKTAILSNDDRQTLISFNVADDIEIIGQSTIKGGTLRIEDLIITYDIQEK